MGQATWKGSAAVLTSALVLLLEGRFPSADICRFRLLWFLCCVVALCMEELGDVFSFVFVGFGVFGCCLTHVLGS
jgi:hypothetical protein